MTEGINTGACITNFNMKVNANFWETPWTPDWNMFSAFLSVILSLRFRIDALMEGNALQNLGQEDSAASHASLRYKWFWVWPSVCRLPERYQIPCILAKKTKVKGRRVRHSLAEIYAVFRRQSLHSCNGKKLIQPRNFVGIGISVIISHRASEIAKPDTAPRIIEYKNKNKLRISFSNSS